MSSKIQSDFKRLKKLLTNPQSWVQYEYALGQDGKRCWSTAPQAVTWCLSSAIDRLVPKMKKPHVIEVLVRTIQKLYPLPQDSICISSQDIKNFNDHPNTKHVDILRVLDECIEVT